MTSQRTRDRLVNRLRSNGIKNESVLSAIGQVPRHLFIDEAMAHRAYEDTALPIGLGQTISQPYVVALMTQALLVDGVPDRVLEVGTGSGYQAAVLAQLVANVYSVERIEELSRLARRRFREVGIRNVRAKCSDGIMGWPENGPYPAIIVTAATAKVSDELFAQLTEGGVLVAPVGQPGHQRLYRYVRHGKKLDRSDLGGVSFVPLLPGMSQ